MSRPILIDERDGPCEICAAHQRGRCDECGAAIGIYQNMGGAGFRSPEPTHWHLELILGVAGRGARYAELCLDCYREQYRLVYPREALPAAPMEMTVPTLPKELTAPVEGVLEVAG